MPDLPGQVQRGREFKATNTLNDIAVQRAQTQMGQEQNVNTMLGRLPNLDPEDRGQFASSLAAQGDPGMRAAQKLQQQWSGMDERQKAAEFQKMDDVADTLSLALENPEAYSSAIAQISQFAPKLAEQLPQTYDENQVKGLIYRVHGAKQQLGGSQVASIQDREDLFGRLPQDESGNLITDPNKMTAEQYAAAVQARVIPAAGTTTGQERAATDPTLGDQIIDYEKTLTESKEFAKLTGSSRAKAIDSADDQIRKIETNIRNLDEAYQALEDGAQSGPVVSKWTPTLKEETQRLEQARGKLGLDVVGAVTFGALSKGELDMALAVALPNLPPTELKQWIRGRQAAQQKLISYFDQQIEHLDADGTVASFRRMQRGASPATTQGSSDDQALEWAQQNPNDPRAQKILQMLGQ